MRREDIANNSKKGEQIGSHIYVTSNILEVKRSRQSFWLGLCTVGTQCVRANDTVEAAMELSLSLYRGTKNNCIKLKPKLCSKEKCNFFSKRRMRNARRRTPASLNKRSTFRILFYRACFKVVRKI